MNFITRWLRRLSASDTAVRAVEESLLDWKHEVDVAPGVLGAFASDFRMAAGIGRLIARVIVHDALDVLRRPWPLQMLLWLFPAMVAVAVVTIASYGINPGIWWWGLPGAALPYAAVLTIGRARRQPPALGLLVMIEVLSVVQLTVWNATHGHPQNLFALWAQHSSWILLPTMCILLGDRIRREARPNRQLIWCGVAWSIGRAIEVPMSSYAGGIYRPLIGWLTVATPAALWLWYLWKQERPTVTEDVEEAHA
jgi:hypothetical protein